MAERVREHDAPRGVGDRSDRVVRRKLEVGRADDPLEHEADRTADIVIERLGRVDEISEDDPKPSRRLLRRNADVEPIGLEGGAVDRSTEQQIASSTGRPLEVGTRASMESAFGFDFSGVRVHTGKQADDLNRRLTARAFTSGSDVFVRSSDYAPDTRAGQRILAHELAHVVQQGGSASPTQRIHRFIMTTKQWMALSTRTGKPRSAPLVKIDQTLAAFNLAQDQSPADRADLLGDIIEAITAWIDTKPSDNQGIVSARRESVLALLDRVETELDVLEATPSAMQSKLGNEPLTEATTSTDIAPAVRDIYRRAIRSTQQLIAKQKGAIKEKAADAIWDNYIWETDDLRGVTRSLDQTVPKNANADRHVRALNAGLHGLATITFQHHNIELPAPKFRISRVKAGLGAQRQGLADDPSAEGVDDFIDTVESDINRLRAISTGGDGSSDPLAWIDDDRGDLIQEVLSITEQATGIGGYFGTGGKGNEGFSEFYQADPQNAAQQNVQQAFSADAPKSAKKQDELSGGMDMGGGLAGLSTDFLNIMAASKTIKDDSASPADKRAAKLLLIGTPTSILANYMKMVGGAFTATRGGGQGTTYKSNFDFTADGTDASTDFKMIGDFAGLFTGIINSIKETLDVFSHFKERTEKQKSGGVRKQLESFGLFFKKIAGTLTSLSNNARSLTKLGYQITGGGQVAASAVSSAASDFMTKAVPGMNLVMGVLDAVQQIYKLVRIGIRRADLTKRIEQIVTGGADLATIETVDFAHDTLVKRSARIGINLGHALTSVTAGALTLSGIGWAPGMVLNLADTASRVGQIGFRTAKQSGRNKKAKQRAEKGPESYEQWKMRKKAQAAAVEGKGKRRWAQFRSAVDIKFTFNWDKSTENKAATVKAVAMEALRMNDDVVFEALGIAKLLSIENNPAARVDIVVEALRKRD